MPECRTGIRYQNELKCHCREQSGTDTGIRGPSPVLKYSGTGLRSRNADASGICLFISESAELTHRALYINHFSETLPYLPTFILALINATKKMRKSTCKVWLRRQERGSLGESPQLQQVDKVEVLEPVGPLASRLLWVEPLVEELQVGSPLSRVLQKEICRVLVGIVGCQVYSDARMQAYK